MERITYKVVDILAGKNLTKESLVMDGDNLTVELALDFTGTIYETWEKRCDLAMPDGTTDILGFDPAVTDVIAVFTLTSAHLKKGALVINPYVQLNDARKGFPKKSVQVVSQLGNDVVNATVQVIINDYIDARLDVKEVITETLAPELEAAVGVNVESDGTSYIFGIPRGLQGEQGIQGERGIQGIQGVQGIQGIQGVQGIQGLKGNRWRGAYSGATAYVVDDVVSYLGSSYICILASTNNLPTNATYWSLFAQAGDVTQANLDLEVKKRSKIFGHRFVKSLGTILSCKTNPVCLLLQGDSTGNDSAEWYEQLIQWLATNNPAYSKLTRTWSDTTQSYSILYYLTNQVGSLGEAYITQNNLTGNYISTPASVNNAITGDLDFSIKINIENQGSNENAALISKYGGSAGERGFSWYYRKDLHRMAFVWSSDGTNFLPIVYSDVIPYTFGQDIWLRITMDADDGVGHYVIKYYTSTNGAQWAQLGSTITGASTTSVFHAPAYPLIFGMNSRSTDVWTGKLYQAVIRTEIDGKVIASPNAGLSFPYGVTTFKDVEGNTWTITGTIKAGNGSPLLLALNGSAPGRDLAYSIDNNRFALQTNIEPQMAFISYGHNQTTEVGLQALYESLCTKLLTKYQNIGVVCVTQNPQKAPRTTTQIYTHANINTQIATLSAKNDYGLIDVFREFIEDDNLANTVSSDGVHPTQAGNDLWANVAKDFMLGSIK